MDRKAYNRWYYLNYRKKGRTIGDGKQFDTKTLGPGQDKKRVKSVLNKAFNSHHTTITSEESHWTMGGKGGSKKRNINNDNKLSKSSRTKSIFSYKSPFLISNKGVIEKGKRKVERFLRKLEKSSHHTTITSEESHWTMGGKGGSRKINTDNDRKPTKSYKAPILISNKKVVEKGRKKVERFLRKLKESTYAEKPTFAEQSLQYQMSNKTNRRKKNR